MGAVPGPTWGAAATTTHSQARPPRPPSLSSPPFALPALRKVSGSPRRLLARGVRSPGPSGRGVGEGSLSGRRSATANFGCARLGTQGVCGGGAPKPRTQRAATEATRAGGTRPRRGRPGQGAGAGWPGPHEPPGTTRPPPLPPWRASCPPPPGAGTHQPRSCGRGDPRPRSPAQPLPHRPPPTWARVRSGGWGHRHPRAERAPRSPERGGGGGGFPSFLLLFLRRARWLQTDLLPLAPCPPLPEPAGLGSACDRERSGAGGSRAAALSLRQARGERGAGRAGGAAAARARAPARAPARARYGRPRQRRDCSTFFLSVSEGFL